MSSSGSQDHSHIQQKRRLNPNKLLHRWKQVGKGVGAGIAIIQPRTPTVKLMYRMDTRCTNNQAEAYAILKALEYIQTTITKEEDKAATVHTDSRTTLDSLYNTDKHS